MIDLDFLLKSAEVCKKCTIFGYLRTTTPAGKKETRQITPFFSSTFWALTVCDIHFCVWKMSKFVFMGSPFWSILDCKIPEFGDESCLIRILSRSIQETYTLKKVNNQVYFFNRVVNQICLISWSKRFVFYKTSPHLKKYFKIIKSFSQRTNERKMGSKKKNEQLRKNIKKLKSNR